MFCILVKYSFYTNYKHLANKTLLLLCFYLKPAQPVGFYCLLVYLLSSWFHKVLPFRSGLCHRQPQGRMQLSV